MVSCVTLVLLFVCVIVVVMSSVNDASRVLAFVVKLCFLCEPVTIVFYRCFLIVIGVPIAVWLLVLWVVILIGFEVLT